MKHLNFFNKIIVAGLMFLGIIIYGCSDISSYNDNPNESSEAPIPYLLTNGQKSLADNLWSQIAMGRFGNLYAQYWSMNQYGSFARYEVVSSTVNSVWNDYYSTLLNFKLIIEQNHERPDKSSVYGNNANQIAASKILLAWTFQTMTDIWGAIPFENALKGSANPSPEYDSQEKVYEGIIRLLTEASDSIDVNQTTFTDGDIFYNGDASKWKKFANSLKLRAAIRIADVKPGVAETAVKEAVQAGVMSSNEDDALFKYLSSSPNNNPNNELYKNRDDYAISSTLMDFLKSNDDPRISAYAAPAVNQKDEVYAGFPYGLSEGNAVQYKSSEPWSRPSQRVREATAPAIFMTYSETLFAEAEAAQRGWISENAADIYKKAIKASMDYWDVNEASATAYITDHPYDAGNWRESIGRQKWAALYMQGLQGWFAWRKLDFGLLTPPVDGKKGVIFDGPIPVRWPYPKVEYDLNQKNVKAAVSMQGWSADDQGQKVWWDVNSGK